VSGVPPPVQLGGVPVCPGGHSKGGVEVKFANTVLLEFITTIHSGSVPVQPPDQLINTPSVAFNFTEVPDE
jgi:hypothetical protein